MEGREELSNDDVPILDMTDYFGWRRNMKYYLKKFGVWDIVINPPIPSRKKTNTVAQNDANKDNTISLKFVFDELSSSIKESVGEQNSTKYLWFMIESEYKRINQDTKK